MDEAVSPIARVTVPLAPLALALGMVAVLAAATGPAAAQALQDPTRPPAAPSAAGSAAAAGPQLQSVLIGRAPGGRRVAVSDGETVRQGESFRGARLTRVGESEVELVRGRERQVLRLYAQAAAPALPATPAAPDGH
jgi:MSHA biogenesis protein MshK